MTQGAIRYLLELAPYDSRPDALAGLERWLDATIHSLGGQVESIDYAVNRGDLRVLLHLPDEALLAGLVEVAEARGQFHVIDASPVMRVDELKAAVEAAVEAVTNPTLTLFVEQPDAERPPGFIRIVVSQVAHFTQADIILQALRAIPGISHLVVDELGNGVMSLHGNYNSPIPLDTRLAKLVDVGVRLEVATPIQYEAPAPGEAVEAVEAVKDEPEGHAHLLHPMRLDAA